MSISEMLKQSDCDHSVLRFGSGDYYVYCTDCLRTWVQIKPGTGDEPCSEHLNNMVQGEDRVKP